MNHRPNDTFTVVKTHILKTAPYTSDEFHTYKGIVESTNLRLFLHEVFKLVLLGTLCIVQKKTDVLLHVWYFRLSIQVFNFLFHFLYFFLHIYFGEKTDFNSFVTFFNLQI